MVLGEGATRLWLWRSSLPLYFGHPGGRCHEAHPLDGRDKIKAKDPHEAVAMWYNWIHYGVLVPEEGKLLLEGIMKLDFETSHLVLRGGAVSQPVASLAHDFNTAQFSPQLPPPSWQVGANKWFFVGKVEAVKDLGNKGRCSWVQFEAKDFAIRLLAWGALQDLFLDLLPGQRVLVVGGSFVTVKYGPVRKPFGIQWQAVSRACSTILPWPAKPFSPVSMPGAAQLFAGIGGAHKESIRSNA